MRAALPWPPRAAAPSHEALRGHSLKTLVSAYAPPSGDCDQWRRLWGGGAALRRALPRQVSSGAGAAAEGCTGAYVRWQNCGAAPRARASSCACCAWLASATLLNLRGAWRCKWRRGGSGSLRRLQALLALHLLFLDGEHKAEQADGPRAVSYIEFCLARVDELSDDEPKAVAVVVDAALSAAADALSAATCPWGGAWGPLLAEAPPMPVFPPYSGLEGRPPRRRGARHAVDEAVERGEAAEVAAGGGGGAGCRTAAGRPQSRSGCVVRAEQVLEAGPLPPSRATGRRFAAKKSSAEWPRCAADVAGRTDPAERERDVLTRARPAERE